MCLHTRMRRIGEARRCGEVALIKGLFPSQRTWSKKPQINRPAHLSKSWSHSHDTINTGKWIQTPSECSFPPSFLPNKQTVLWRWEKKDEKQLLGWEKGYDEEKCHVLPQGKSARGGGALDDCSVLKCSGVRLQATQWGLPPGNLPTFSTLRWHEETKADPNTRVCGPLWSDTTSPSRRGRTGRNPSKSNNEFEVVWHPFIMQILEPFFIMKRPHYGKIRYFLSAGKQQCTKRNCCYGNYGKGGI